MIDFRSSLIIFNFLIVTFIDDDIFEILNFLKQQLLLLIWISLLGVQVANIFSQLQNVFNIWVHHSQLSLTYLIDFKCLTGSKSRFIRSVNFLNFKF
jgi:hypothetical protein